MPITNSEPFDDGIKMAHFGSLGGVRNLEKFIEGLELANRRTPEIQSSLSIDLFGNVGNDDMMRIEASPMGNNFFLKGLVPRAESVKVMQDYDVLLLIQGVHDISRETIPSKLYEYLQSGRPVLGMIHENSELGDLMKSLGHIPVQADSAEEIARALEGFLAGGRRSDVHVVQSSPYTIERAVQELLAG